MNNRGALTLDFIFAIVLVTGLSGILLALSLTLAVVESAQYVAFASSRAYFATHLNEQKQAEQAKAKFEQLKANKAFRLVFNAEWFGVKYVDGHDFRSEYDNEEAVSTFVGTRLLFNAEMLKFDIPFFGSTAEDGQGFKANINSYLGREPTWQECMDYVEQRFKQIQALDPSRWANIPSVDDNSYIVHADNGC
jgi:hypothetical protein